VYIQNVLLTFFVGFKFEEFNLWGLEESRPTADEDRRTNAFRSTTTACNLASCILQAMRRLQYLGFLRILRSNNKCIYSEIPRAGSSPNRCSTITLFQRPIVFNELMSCLSYGYPATRRSSPTRNKPCRAQFSISSLRARTAKPRDKLPRVTGEQIPIPLNQR
jgi:hypothetical protein